MAINDAGIRVVLAGTRTGGEVWNTTFWLDVQPTAGGTVSQADLNAIALNLGNLFQTTCWNAATSPLKGLASADTNFNACRAYFYPAASPVATVVADVAIPDAVLGTSVTFHPYSVAVVCSLRTANASRRGRGRMYLPLNGCPMVGGGQYNSVNVTNIAQKMKAYFDAINASAQPGLTDQVVAVASNTAGVSFGVTSIIVDSNPDTQRRRDDRVTPATVSVQPIVI